MDADTALGQELALSFLRRCERKGATGTAVLNAMGNALVGFFMSTKFNSHEERMIEVDQWCEQLREEIGTAHRRTAARDSRKEG